MAEISLEKVLKKAKLHEMKGEFTEAKKLYQQVLQIFPKNIRAQQALSRLIEFRQNHTKKKQPIESIDKLLNLYNKGNFLTVVEQVQILIDQYPSSFFLWNILGASATEIGMIDKAIKAYKTVTKGNLQNPYAFELKRMLFEKASTPSQEREVLSDIRELIYDGL